MTTLTIDPKNFVRTIELLSPKYEIELNTRENLFENYFESAEEQKPEAFINNKSIVSFVANVNTQNRQDILHSTLLAQLAANKKFPKEEDTLKWFQTYKEVLANVGWVLQGKDFSNFITSSSIFEMNAAIIEIFGSTIGGNMITILNKTLDAIRSLGEANNKIIAFEKNTHTISKGSFQIAVADETKDTATLNVGSFILNAEKVITQILFFTSSKDEFELKSSSIQGTLDKDIYSSVREDIVSKLGDSVSRFVARIEI